MNYATVEGTALAGSDYIETNGVITFAPGQTTQTIAVPVLGDRLDETNETFSVALTNPTNITLSNPQSTTTIVDNDNLPNLIISNTAVTENENGITQAFLTVSLSEVSGQTVTVNYTTANGTAIADYGKRWGIETLFGCLKTRGFCLESTHLQDPERLSRMIALLTIALCWAFLTGEWWASQQAIVIKKHGRKAKSIFCHGFDHLREILFNLESRMDELFQVLTFLSCT